MTILCDGYLLVINLSITGLGLRVPGYLVKCDPGYFSKNNLDEI